MNLTSKTRIIGFDLARAYAILGMFIVNYNSVFGSFTDSSLLGQFLSLFSGNSSSVFVMLAGMGIALMTNRNEYSPEERANLKRTISKRSWFLTAVGLLLYTWWPADILHFYGGYMHIALLILFLPKQYYLWFAGLMIIIFHGLLLVIPYESGWNFDTLQYLDFWTIEGFLRNTFYNGWNPIFPWTAYFIMGMWLGRLDWSTLKIQRKMFLMGLSLFLFIWGIQLYASHYITDKDIQFYLTADYIPPFLPFMISTFAFGLMLISFFMYVGGKVENNKWAMIFASTGQMTLTHYVSHLTIGMLIFGLLTGKDYEGIHSQTASATPLSILGFAIFYFTLSFVFSKIWSKKYKNGPLEALMRRISG
jgi:uncharacterized protein